MLIEDINQLDKDGILDEAVLVELFQISDVKRRNQIYEELVGRAKILNCKMKFDQAYRIFKARNSTATRNIKGYESGPWTYDPAVGIYRETEKGICVACPHLIYISRVFSDVANGSYKIELTWQRRGITKTVIVDRAKIANNSKIVALAELGIAVTSESSKNLVKYLADMEALNENLIVECYSSEKLGFVKVGDQTYFIPYDEDVEFDAGNKMDPIYSSIHTSGDRAKWLKIAREVREKSGPEIRLYMAAGLASLLVEPCGGLPFIISLSGLSGKGKTAALKLVASIFGHPEKGFICDAKSTKTAQEARLDTLNNFPALIDDLSQIKSQCDGDFTEFIYRVCSGQGKDRSNVNLTLNKPKTWKNCILTNSENSLVSETMQGGAINRIIDVEVSDKGVFASDDMARETCDTVRSNYGFCGVEFYELIKGTSAKALEELQQKFIEAIRESAAKHNKIKEEKQIIPMALILAADFMSNAIYADDILLDVDWCTSLLKDKGVVDEQRRCYQYIVNEVGVNLVKFNQSEFYNGEQWGMFKEEEGKSVAVINGNVFDRILEKGGFNPTSFLEYAKKHELIIPERRTGKPRRNVKVKGIASRHVFVVLPDDANFVDVSEVAEEIPFNE